MSYYRPAGYSDDEDDDDFEFSTEYDDISYRNQGSQEKEPESKEILLYSALKEGDITTMRTVLDGNFPVDKPLSGEWSALMHACTLGLFPIVEFLIAEGANVNFSKDLFTPLMALCNSISASNEDRVKCLDLLLENGANINAIDRSACTALMYACMAGQTSLVEKLLHYKCDVNVQDIEGWSALFHAVNGGYEDIIRILLDGKARVDLIDRRRRSAYELALTKGFEHLGKLVCSKKEKRKLLEAEKVGNSLEKKLSDPIEELMAQLPSANAKNSYGFSSDVSKLLWSMGLGHLSKQFTANNVQLNECLLVTDERLKELGVRFSIHRQRILNSVRKFHLHPWSKSSLGLKPRNQQLNMDDAVKLMCNVVKHLHILDASINYVRIYQPVPIRPEVFKMCESAAHQLSLISGELSNIQYFASQLNVREHIEPIDLIKPRKKPGRSCLSPMFVTTVLIGFVIWKRKYFISLPIFEGFKN